MMHEESSSLNIINDVIFVAVSSVKKKAVNFFINITVQTLIVIENHQFHYLLKHHGYQSYTDHLKRE